MTTPDKWKSKLISSSVPLEFEAARALASLGFSVSADYIYARDDSGLEKDFSIDIHADAWAPFTNPNKLKIQLDLLVECKQRHESVRWLFFPDPNRGEFSPFTLGQTLSACDEFSQEFLEPDCTIALDLQATHCYKGIEVNEENGQVYDSELKHGIAQLQYGLPRLLADNIWFNCAFPSEDNHPFLACPILLTTAELLVAKPGLTRSDVERASSLYQIASPKPYVIMYADTGPDFTRHCIREFERLKILDADMLKSLGEYRLHRGEYEHNLPIPLIRSLMAGSRWALSRFTQFIICNDSEFESLVKTIKNITSVASRKLRESQ